MNKEEKMKLLDNYFSDPESPTYSFCDMSSEEYLYLKGLLMQDIKIDFLFDELTS